MLKTFLLDVLKTHCKVSPDFDVDIEDKQRLRLLLVLVMMKTVVLASVRESCSGCLLDILKTHCKVSPDFDVVDLEESTMGCSLDLDAEDLTQILSSVFEL